MRDEVVRSETYTQFEVMKDDQWETVMVKGKKPPSWVVDNYRTEENNYMQFRNLVYGKLFWAMDTEHFMEEAHQSLVITERVKGYESLCN